MTTETISPAIQALLDLFASDLHGLKFPDLDASILEDAADLTRVHASALERAEASAEAARALLAESQEALVHKAQRAVAYLRIYAEETPGIAPKLDAINLPRTARKVSRAEGSLELSSAELRSPAVSRRRGRPPKTKDGTNPLFAESNAAEVSPPRESPSTYA